MSDEVLPLLPLLMEPVVPVEGCMVEELVPPLPVVGALLPMVPGVVPMLADELLLVWPLDMEPLLVPAPVVEPMLPELVLPEPEVLPAPAPVTLGLVAVLGPVGAGTPGVAAPMPVLLGLFVVPAPEDWAWTMPVAAAAQTAAASRLLRMMLM